MDDAKRREIVANQLAGLAMDDPRAVELMRDAGDESAWNGWYPTAAWAAAGRRWVYGDDLADAGSPTNGTVVLADEAVVSVDDYRAALAVGDARAKQSDVIDEELNA